MARIPRVALIVEMSGIYGRQILQGISRYLRSHKPWSIFLEQRELRAPPPPWLLCRQWDGVICRSTDRTLARKLLRRKIPAVDILPYNRAAGGKYAPCGMAFRPTYDESRDIHANTSVFSTRGIPASLTGV
jgi:hypothetical protein